MWLTKDERNLLIGYYKTVEDGSQGSILGSNTYNRNEMKRLLSGKGAGSRVNPVTANSSQEVIREVAKLLQIDAQQKRANELLAARNLIEYTPSQPELGSSSVTIALTLNGLDLGRKYSRFLARSGMWFREYKDHWIVFLLAVVGGSISARLLNW